MKTILIIALLFFYALAVKADDYYDIPVGWEKVVEFDSTTFATTFISDNINSATEDKNIFFATDTLKIDTTSNINRNIPNEYLILEYNFIPSMITGYYEKNIFDISNNQKLYFQVGVGFSFAFVLPDGIAIPVNLKYVLGKYNCLEIGTGILLNGYFFKNKSLGFLSSDLVKLNADISYRYNIKYINGIQENTELFKISFGFVYMFNSPGTKDQYGGSPFIHFVPRLGLSFNLWTL